VESPPSAAKSPALVPTYQAGSLKDNACRRFADFLLTDDGGVLAWATRGCGMVDPSRR
jgi:hypothetical protein